MKGWSERSERQRMEQLATDGGDHEWGWYVDDVPTLLELGDALAQALREHDPRAVALRRWDEMSGVYGQVRSGD